MRSLILFDLVLSQRAKRWTRQSLCIVRGASKQNSAAVMSRFIVKARELPREQGLASRREEERGRRGRDQRMRDLPKLLFRGVKILYIVDEVYCHTSCRAIKKMGQRTSEISAQTESHWGLDNMKTKNSNRLLGSP